MSLGVACLVNLTYACKTQVFSFDHVSIAGDMVLCLCVEKFIFSASIISFSEIGMPNFFSLSKLDKIKMRLRE